MKSKGKRGLSVLIILSLMLTTLAGAVMFAYAEETAAEKTLEQKCEEMTSDATL